MPERGGGVYSRLDARANTRKSDRMPRKSYVKGVPRPKIHIFETGNVKGNFDTELTIVSDINVQVKHNALEAARIAATKRLTTTLGSVNFFMKIRVYPHHILRENPLATGAGADRFQEGMTRAFGKPIGMAARLRRGQAIMSVRVRKRRIEEAKDACRVAKMKFPMKCRIIIKDLKSK